MEDRAIKNTPGGSIELAVDNGLSVAIHIVGCGYGLYELTPTDILDFHAAYRIDSPHAGSLCPKVYKLDISYRSESRREFLFPCLIMILVRVNIRVDDNRKIVVERGDRCPVAIDCERIVGV